MSYLPNNKQISVSIFPNLEKNLYTYDASGKRNDEMQSQIHPKKNQRHGQVMIPCGSDLKGKTVYPKNNKTKPAPRLLCKVNKCQITTEMCLCLEELCCCLFMLFHADFVVIRERGMHCQTCSIAPGIPLH